MKSKDSPYLLGKIQEMFEENPEISWHEVGKRLNRHPEQIRSLYRRSIMRGEFPTEVPPFIGNIDESTMFCEDKKYREDIDWRELIDHARDGAEINERLSVTQEIGTVNIKSDIPVAVTYTGDWHLGSNTVDYPQWVCDMQYVMDTDGLYMVTLGDDNENMRSFKMLSSVLSQVLSPPQQVNLMFSLVDELIEKNKLLAKVSGNHDFEFDERLFGQSLMAYLYKGLKTPVFENRGVLKLKIGDQIYSNLLFHKSRFKSFMRPTHGAYREWQYSYPAEVVVGAHDHTPGAEIMYGYTLAQQDGSEIGGEVFLVKVGSYQDGDYGWRYFHNGSIMNPTVVYYPDQHKKLLFTNPKDAMQYINGN
jgi:hypothetical protein